MRRTGLGLWIAAFATGCGSDRGIRFLTELDEFAQAPNNEVDILFVVDDSNSMAEEQAILVNGFFSFAGQLQSSKTDFHLGVITTSFVYDDPKRGELIGDPGYLTLDDDYEAEFTTRTTVGTGGSDKEKGLEAALYAVSPTMTLPGGRNEGFIRKAAQLLVVIVSDEQDCSDGGALEGQPSSACYTESDDLTPVPSWVEDMRSLKDDPSLVQVGAIVGLPSSECDNVFSGSRYVQAAILTGGLAGDICRSDWSTVLTNLGLNATGIRTSFQLSRAAQPDTLVVQVDGVEVAEDPTDGWTYDVPTWYVTFHGASVPPRGSVITAEYTIDGSRSEPEVTATTVTSSAP
jgi:hypothetical protein